MKTQTQILRNFLIPGPRRSSRDTVGGWDEMQGYGENVYGDTVGLSWGDVGHTANLAFNPVAQYHALQRAFGNGPPAGSQVRQQPMPRAPMLPPNAVQGMQSGPRRLLSYMGLGTLTWTSSDTVTEKLLQAEPQAAFRGRRLVISQAKAGSATGIACTITKPLTVSGMPQTPAPDQAAPVEMFDAACTYAMLDLQIATSATQISIGISVSSLPVSAGDTVIVACGLYGEWLR